MDSVILNIGYEFIGNDEYRFITDKTFHYIRKHKGKYDFFGHRTEDIKEIYKTGDLSLKKEDVEYIAKILIKNHS